MLRHIKLLIFDLDFLVFDSVGLKLKALRQGLISFADEIPQSVRLPDAADEEECYRELGFRWIEALDLGLSEDFLPTLSEACRAHEQVLIEAGAGQLYPGVAQMLFDYGRQQVSLALGADAHRDYLMAISDRHQLDRLFGNALCTQEFGMGAVDEMLEEIMRLAEVNRSEAVVLGTRPEFFRAARDLDIVAVGCGWGIEKQEALAEADYRVRTIADLPPVILRADEIATRNY